MIRSPTRHTTRHTAHRTRHTPHSVRHAPLRTPPCTHAARSACGARSCTRCTHPLRAVCVGNCTQGAGYHRRHPILAHAARQPRMGQPHSHAHLYGYRPSAFSLTRQLREATESPNVVGCKLSASLDRGGRKVTRGSRVLRARERAFGGSYLTHFNLCPPHPPGSF